MTFSLPSRDSRVTKAEQAALEKKLNALLARAHDSASAEPDPSLQHQLGDVYTELHRGPEALAAYGKAIDGFLAAGKASVVAVVCSKVIKRYPTVTRTHFTLACCLLHAGRVDDALQALDAYTRATLRSNTTGLAIPRLRFLTEVFTESEVRQRLAGMLARVGDDQAERIAQGNPPVHAANLAPEKRRELFLEMATWGSDALWSGYWLRGG